MNRLEKLKMYKEINELIGTSYRTDREIDWRKLSRRKLSEDFIEEYKDKLDWGLLSSYQILSDSFIEKYKDLISWNYVSCSQTPSKEFLLRHKDKLSWDLVSSHQVFSPEDLLNKDFQPLLHWEKILLYQPYIDLDSLVIKDIQASEVKNYVSLNVAYLLYQETKNQGWFIYNIGEINKDQYKTDIDFTGLDLAFNPEIFVNKVRIWWKDLKNLTWIDKFEFIRMFKSV